MDHLISIEVGSPWMHMNDGYWVNIADLGDKPKVKDANDANWSDAVGYQRQDETEFASDGDHSASIYIRTRSDFLNKFTQSDETG